jgi:hypothetical protein
MRGAVIAKEAESGYLMILRLSLFLLLLARAMMKAGIRIHFKFGAAGVYNL